MIAPGGVWVNKFKFEFVDREVNRTRGSKLKILQEHDQYNLSPSIFFLTELFKCGIVFRIL